MYGIKKGIYTPQNLKKYIGKNLPTYRSSWELKAFISLDKNPKISKWGSENFIIPYIDVTRNNETHKYIVDIFFEIADVTKNGLPIKWLIEIKPHSQSITPKSRKGKSTQKLLNETIIVERNKCKWKAAVAFCKAKRLAFWCIY